jgi:hypothetical protein
MLTSEALVGCLQLIGRQLEPWGTLALGVVNPNAKRLARPPADRFRRAHSSPEGVRVHERATYHPAGQVLKAVWRVQDDQGGVHPLEPLRLRQTFPSEVPGFLASAGLELVERFGRSERRRFTSTRRNQVCIAQHLAAAPVQ